MFLDMNIKISIKSTRLVLASLKMDLNTNYIPFPPINENSTLRTLK